MRFQPFANKEIRLAILGMSPGNGHPYSWSAIFNRYNREKMTKGCPYPIIPSYLNKQPEATLTIPRVKVTHICCTGNGEFTAEHVAACTNIPNVVENPEELIDQVDAAIIATDIGSEHVERCRPFVEAGLPLFVDKPMVDNETDLAVFDQWIDQGHIILSGSSMRYTKEFLPYHLSTHNLGKINAISMSMAKKWETYGIHALEAIYPILGPGFLTCRNIGDKERNVVHYTHRCGADVLILVRNDMGAGAGLLTIQGSDGCDTIKSMDSFYAFKTQLEHFIQYLRTGIRPYPYAETRELMKMLIAGLRSRQTQGTQIEIGA